MISSGRIAVDPSAPLPLAGYAARHALASPSTDVLEANWMAWQEPNAGLSLILTLDTLFSSSSFEAALRDHLAGQGVALENLAVIASHTHFAPSIDPEKPNLGVCDPEYIDHVAKQVTRSVLGGLDTAKSITRVSAHRSVAPDPSIAVVGGCGSSSAGHCWNAVHRCFQTPRGRSPEQCASGVSRPLRGGLRSLW